MPPEARLHSKLFEKLQEVVACRIASFSSLLTFVNSLLVVVTVVFILIQIEHAFENLGNGNCSSSNMFSLHLLPVFVERLLQLKRLLPLKCI